MYSAESDSLYTRIFRRVSITRRDFLISSLNADDWGLVPEYDARELVANGLNMHLQSLVNLGPQRTWQEVWQDMETFTMRFSDAVNEQTRERIKLLEEVFDRLTNYD